MRNRAEDIELRGEGFYTIKKVGNQEYLYKVHYEKGKPVWDIVGNVKDMDPKDPNLAKARAVMLSKEAKDIFEKYCCGLIDKTKARNELTKLLDFA
jgi:hypothetical protein